MSLLEGIGDEVLFSFVAGGLLIAILFTWATDFFRNFSFLNTQSDTSIPPPTVRTSPENRPTNLNTSRLNSVRETIEELNEDEIDSTNSVTPEPNQSENDNLQAEPIVNSNVVNENSGDSDKQADSQTESENEPDSNDPESLRLKRLEFFTKTPDTDKPSSSKTKRNQSKSTASTKPVENGHTHTDNVPTETVREESDIPVNSSEAARGYFNIRLKSLDDSERVVRGKANQTISVFKREYFAAEVASNKTVRLIYNGQVLQDGQTLGSYNIRDGCVVHVQISSINLTTPVGETQSDSELDLGQFFWPLLGVLLGIVWMLYFQYKEYFNASSTIALLGLSGLFLTIVWGQYARPPEAGANG